MDFVPFGSAVIGQSCRIAGNNNHSGHSTNLSDFELLAVHETTGLGRSFSLHSPWRGNLPSVYIK